MMMPLTMATIGEVQTIKKVGGKQEVKLFLESLGFTTGATVTIVSKNQGNLITKIKESRLAISQEMANYSSKIYRRVKKCQLQLH